MVVGEECVVAVGVHDVSTLWLRDGRAGGGGGGGSGVSGNCGGGDDGDAVVGVEVDVADCTHGAYL